MSFKVATVAVRENAHDHPRNCRDVPEVDRAGYLIHFSRYNIGSEPNRVYGSGIFSETADVEMAASISLNFPGAMTARLTSSDQFGYCQATRLLGNHGWMQMDLPYDQTECPRPEICRSKRPAVSTVHIL